MSRTQGDPWTKARQRARPEHRKTLRNELLQTDDSLLGQLVMRVLVEAGITTFASAREAGEAHWRRRPQPLEYEASFEALLRSSSLAASSISVQTMTSDLLLVALRGLAKAIVLRDAPVNRSSSWCLRSWQGQLPLQDLAGRALLQPCIAVDHAKGHKGDGHSPSMLPQQCSRRAFVPAMMPASAGAVAAAPYEDLLLPPTRQIAISMSRVSRLQLLQPASTALRCLSAQRPPRSRSHVSIDDLGLLLRAAQSRSRCNIMSSAPSKPLRPPRGWPQKGEIIGGRQLGRVGQPQVLSPSIRCAAYLANKMDVAALMSDLVLRLPPSRSHKHSASRSSRSFSGMQGESACLGSKLELVEEGRAVLYGRSASMAHLFASPARWQTKILLQELALSMSLDYPRFAAPVTTLQTPPPAAMLRRPMLSTRLDPPLPTRTNLSLRLTPFQVQCRWRGKQSATTAVLQQPSTSLRLRHILAASARLSGSLPHRAPHCAQKIRFPGDELLTHGQFVRSCRLQRLRLKNVPSLSIVLAPTPRIWPLQIALAMPSAPSVICCRIAATSMPLEPRVSKEMQYPCYPNDANAVSVRSHWNADAFSNLVGAQATRLASSAASSSAPGDPDAVGDDDEPENEPAIEAQSCASHETAVSDAEDDDFMFLEALTVSSSASEATASCAASGCEPESDHEGDGSATVLVEEFTAEDATALTSEEQDEDVEGWLMVGPR